MSVIGNDNPELLEKRISELEHTIRELTRMSDIYQIAFLQSQIAKFIFDDKGKLVNCNKSGLELFGLNSFEEISNYNLFDNKLVTAEISEKIKVNKDLNFEVFFDFDNFKLKSNFVSNKTGKYYFDIFIYPTFSNNKISGYFIQIVDITERKLKDEELKRYNEELKIAVSTKDKLFSIIAHDLKSPFNGILGYSEILLEHIDDFDISESKHFLTQLNSMSKNAYELLTNLLSWAKSQTGQIMFNPENINLHYFVRDIIYSLENVAKIKNIEIKFNIDKNINFCADINMLNTVLRNLLNNAIKYTYHYGVIVISAKIYERDLEISVQDSGVGIDETMLGKLFKIGEHFSLKGTSNEDGTGLGLLICKEFVEQHGGKIWVDSILGHGSTFTFNIPQSKN